MLYTAPRFLDEMSCTFDTPRVLVGKTTRGSVSEVYGSFYLISSVQQGTGFLVSLGAFCVTRATRASPQGQFVHTHVP